MSRIGKLPIVVPNGVTITVDPDKIIIKGQKGELTLAHQNGIDVKVADNQVVVSRQNEDDKVRSRFATDFN